MSGPEGCLLHVLMLLVGLAVLAKAADMLVDGAVSLSRRVRVSELVVGLTVCAFGTSAPELFVNVSASLAGRDALVLGNVIGSNIFNTLVVLGVGALIFPLAVQRGTLKWELPAGILAWVVFALLAADPWSAGPGVLTRADGAVLLAGFVGFLFYTFRLSESEDCEACSEDEMSLGTAAAFTIVGLVGLPAASHFVVEGATGLARMLGLSEQLIGLTLVSGGTSLPELAATAAAAWHRRPDLAVGNVVGSNIFNLLLVLGASCALAPVDYLPQLTVDGLVFAGASLVVLFAGVVGKGVLGRPIGVVLLAGFVGYLVFLGLREARQGAVVDGPVMNVIVD